MMAVNLKAPMRLTRALAPGMVDKASAQGQGQERGKAKKWMHAKAAGRGRRGVQLFVQFYDSATPSVWQCRRRLRLGRAGPAQERKLVHKRSGSPPSLLCFQASRHPSPSVQGDGVIINIADVEATHTGPRHPAYAASKHALRGWSQSCYEVLSQLAGVHWPAGKAGSQ